MKTQKICCAGFGGQGALSMGRMLAYAGMLEGSEVSWCPSYGPEMRGGTANCHVIIDDAPIGSPVISKNATCLIAMNQPSLDKFVDIIADDGVIVINKDIVEMKVEKPGAKVVSIPANSMAIQEFGAARLANMILLGAVIKATEAVKFDSVEEALAKVFSGPKAKFVPDNKKAFAMGYEFQG